MIRHGMYVIFIITDPTNNSNNTCDLFRHSGRFNLQQVIEYVYTFNSTYDQYELDWLDLIGRYMCKCLNPSLLDNNLHKNTVTSPVTVVLVEIFFTVSYVSFNTMDQCKKVLSIVKIADFPGENVTACWLNIKYLCEHLEVSGYWDHFFVVVITKNSKGCSE